jgi:hypothetical protein
MYLPPLCLEVLKDELVRLFAPPPEIGRINSTASSLPSYKRDIVLLHAEGIVGAARCAASLACCGNAQLSELARCLCDRVVDPGYATAVTAAAAAERDLEEGHTVASASVHRYVRPHIAALISGIVEGATNTPPLTIALSDAEFVHRIPRTLLHHLPSTTRFSGTTRYWRVPPCGGTAAEIVQNASCRLLIRDVLPLVLSRAVAAAAAEARHPPSDEEEANAHPSDDDDERCVSALVEDLFPDDPPDLRYDREYTFIYSDWDLGMMVEDTRYGLEVIRGVMRRIVDRMERLRVLNDALHAEGLLPSDASLYVAYGDRYLLREIDEMSPLMLATLKGAPLTLETVVTAAKFEAAFRCPVLLRWTSGGDIEWQLKNLWIAEVHAVLHRNEEHAFYATMDRMTATVAAIDGDTVPNVSGGEGTLSDILALPRGSEQAEVFANIHAACCMDAVVSTVRTYPRDTSFFTLLDRVAAAASEYRRTNPHAKTYERLRACPTDDVLRIEVARFSQQQRDNRQFHFTCPLCESSKKHYSVFSLFSHLVDSHGGEKVKK